jgi:hypothetical protein
MLRACRESAGEIDAIFFGGVKECSEMRQEKGGTYSIVKQIGHSHTVL